MTDTIAAARDALDPARRAAFERRVEREARSLQDDVRDGVFDAEAFALGLELEAYVVDDAGRIATAPEALFDVDGCSRELGVHNAELHTSPDVASDAGFRRQFDELHDVSETVASVLGDDGLGLVFDAMWTVPPEGGTMQYLEAGTETEGVFCATHMRPVPRYVALDQVIRDRNGGRIEMDLPGLADARSLLVESLATSMQPHLQLPEPAAVPRYLNVATRTMGPVLSLSANSPFLPADRYESVGGDDPATLIGRAPHEHRIPIFERSVDEGSRKCRVPRDVDSVAALIDRIAADPTLVAVPDLDEGKDAESGSADKGHAGLKDRYPAFDAKRGTYWRWVRPVFGGDVPRGVDGDPSPGADGASVRIEYRPLPTQPTLRDTVGLQALVVGLLCGVDATDHPLATLPWDDARVSFYAAVDDGPDADLRWVTRDGDDTTATGEIYDELFALARRGLDDLGVGAETIEWALAPIEARRETAHVSPSAWKRERVREALGDGASLPAAVREMQAAYLERAASGVPFAQW
ncbi:MAG: hypothetical protein ABEK02_06565 [Haloquadratum sp.]